MREEVKKEIESLNSIQTQIEDLVVQRYRHMDALIPHLATFNVGDTIVRSRGGFVERAVIVTRLPVWFPDERRFDIQYEARKIKKDGGLHGLVTKFYDAEASLSQYEWKKENDEKFRHKGDAPSDILSAPTTGPRFAFGEE